MIVFVAGCRGVPTANEKAIRKEAQSVAEKYRPDNRRPTLPILGSNSPLSDFLAYAMLNQPKVEAAYYDWLASIERITTARSLPDPQLTFQMDIQDIVTSVMPGFMVNLPGPGKLRAAADVASAQSEAGYYIFQSRILETAFDVKRAYYQLYFLQDKTRITRETVALLSDLEKLARAQNEVGKVTLQDVLRAQIEQDRLNTDLANLEDSRRPLLAEFKSALGLTPSQEIPPLPSRFESTPLDTPVERIFETALASNRNLKALSSEVQAAEAAIVAAERGRRPDFSIGLMADAKMNPILYRPLGTVTLPIWRDKIAAQIAEAQNRKRATEARLSAEQIQLAVSLAERTFAYREASRNLSLLQQQLIPKQRQSFEVARSGYLAGQIDFFNLTDAEQSLLRFRLAEVEARTQRELALAELSLLMAGMSPSGSPMGGSGGGAESTGNRARSSRSAGSQPMNTMK